MIVPQSRRLGPHGGQSRRRNAACDPEAAVFGLNLIGRLCVIRSSKAACVDVGQVSQIEQILMQTDVVAFEIKIIARGRPVIILQPGSRWNQLGIGLRRVAEPSPDEWASLDERKRSNTDACGTVELRRNLDAISGLVVPQAVIAAYDGVSIEHSGRKRIRAMSTSILHSDGSSTPRSEHHQPVAKHGTLEQSAAISSANATTYHSSLMNGVSRSAIWRIAFWETRSSDGCGTVMMNPTQWATARSPSHRLR